MHRVFSHFSHHRSYSLKPIGKSAHIFKIDIMQSFRHVKVDPKDYDLMGLYWDGASIDTCILFGSQHGMQIFQHQITPYVTCCVHVGILL